MTQVAYAKRRGVSKMAVSRAIKKGRLRTCVVRGPNGEPLGISDPELADREWLAYSDYTDAPQRAPEGYGKTRPPAVADDARPEQAAAPAPAVTPRFHGLGAPPASMPTVEDLAASGEITAAPQDPDSIGNAATREKHWKAKLAELKYRQEAGELVEAAAVSKRLTDTFSMCRTKLLGVPTRTRQRLPHLSLDDFTVIEELVREALEDLSNPQEKIA
jgi:hypothetical protein